MWIGFIWLRIGAGGELWKHDNEPLISIKGGKVLVSEDGPDDGGSKDL
jgi:hypothetical protein